MLLHTIDQRFFCLRTGFLPICTVIKSSPFSQAPRVFSFPPSSLKSESILGKLMEWFCREGDPERLSSPRPRIPSPSQQTHQAVPYLSPQSPSIAGSESTPESQQRPIWHVCEAMTYKGQLPPFPRGDLTLEHTSGILFQMTISHFLCCQPLSHLSPVSHFIFCNKFLLGNYNSLRLETLIRNHLSHVKLWFFWSEQHQVATLSLHRANGLFIPYTMLPS